MTSVFPPVRFTRAKIYRNCFQLLYFFYVFSPAGGKTEVTRSQKLEKPCPAGGLGVTPLILERSRRGHGEVTAALAKGCKGARPLPAKGRSSNRAPDERAKVASGKAATTHPAKAKVARLLLAKRKRPLPAHEHRIASTPGAKW